MASGSYTIYNEYIDEELSWFPVTVSMATTAAPAGFWEGLDNKKLVSDIFTGANGSAPDSDRWTNSGTSIQGNKLRLNSTSSVQVDSVFTLQGDFVVEHDFTMNLHPETERWYYQMRATDVTSGSGDLFSVLREYRTTNRYVCFKANGGIEDPVNGVTVNSDDLTGKLRLRRIGTTMYGDYYHPTNGWTNITSESMTGLTGDVQIGLWLRRSGSNPVAEMDIDYFKVTYADSIDWTADDTGLDADDNFIGVDDAVPNERLWNIANGSPTIQSNKLNLTTGSGNTTENVSSKFNCSGNFDVRVDWDIPSAPAAVSYGHELRIYSQVNTAQHVLVRREHNSNYFAASYDSSYHTISTTGTSDLSGKFRIERNGSTVECYYYNSGWISLGTDSFDVLSTDNVAIVLLQGVWDTLPDFEGNFDNFTINYADDITWNNLADRVYFTDSDSNRLYTEIETFDTETSAATYHTAVPTISAGVDTPLTVNWDWESRDYSVRELPATDYSDHFTGSNGSAPDTTKWESVGGNTTIQNNKINMPLGVGESNALTQAHWINEDIVGNFDIQVDYDLVTYPNTSFWGAQIVIEDVDGEGCSLVRGWYGSQSYRTWENNLGWQGTDVTTDTSGKLRVTRVGTVWTTYTWNGSSWDTNHTWDPGTAADIDTIYLTNQHGDTNPAIEINWDNFQFNHSQYTPDEVNDTFTGTDGDAPDPLKWRQTGNIITNIQSNTLGWDSNEATDQNTYDIYRALISDDFDFQVDYNIFNEVTPASSLHYAIVQIITSSSNGYIARAKNNSGNSEYIYSGFGDAWTSFVTSDTSGKLRFKRVNGTITGYHWNAGSTQWEWNGNTAGHVFTNTDTNDVEVRLWTKQEANARWNGNWDNFIVNGADSITGWTDTTGNHPAQQVWDGNYKLVTHMHTTPTGSADDILDSTSNDNHGKSINMDSSNSGESELGKYLTFNGSNEYIQFGDAFYSDTLTIECVPTVASFTGGQPRMLFHKRNVAGTTTTNSFASEWAIQYIDEDTLSIQAWGEILDDQVIGCGINSTPDITDLTGVEIYFAEAFDPIGEDGTITAQINDGTTDCVRAERIVQNDTAGIQFGTRSNNNNSRWFHGNLREGRISNIYRSDAWRLASYHSLMGNLFNEPAPTQWDLIIQDMTIATSMSQVEFIVNLIIQNLNVLTSAEATKIIPLLNINDLNINTAVGRMNFWDALSTINTSMEFRTLLRTILSRTPKHTLEFKTLKRTLKQYDG